MDDPRLAAQLTSLGKGMVQVNLRLSRITELLEAGGGAGAAPEEGPALDVLLDLVEAVDRTLASPRLPAAPASWWQRTFGPPPPPPVDLSGLALAREHAVARLAEAGIEPVPDEGPVEPRLHRVIEVLSTDDPALDGTIATTHRPGWTRRADPPVVLRHAHVSAFRAPES